MATLLPLTGQDPALGHDRWDPSRWTGLVAATTTLLGALDLAPRWSSRPRPVPEQIGGVARADRPCPVGHRRRS